MRALGTVLSDCSLSLGRAACASMGHAWGPGTRLRRGTCKEAIVGADLYGSSNQTHLGEQNSSTLAV